MSTLHFGNPSADGRDKVRVSLAFPDDWTVIAFDEASPQKPYANRDRPRFDNWKIRASWRERDEAKNKVRKWGAPTGCKAVDAVAYSPGAEAEAGTVYLIEVTDYRAAEPDEILAPADLADEFATKVRDSLAALALGRAPRDGGCASFTQALGSGARVCLVLHFFRKDDSLTGRDMDLGVYEALAKVLRPLGLQLFLDSTAGQDLPWAVSESSFAEDK